MCKQRVSSVLPVHRAPAQCEAWGIHGSHRRVSCSDLPQQNTTVQKQRLCVPNGRATRLGEANVDTPPTDGRRKQSLFVPNAARPRCSIFTNHRKVLLFLIREARPVRNQRGKARSSIFTKVRKVLRTWRSQCRPLFVNYRAPPCSPNAILPKQNPPHPHTVSPTHRKVRSAIPPKPHSEATKPMQPRP